jgi:hypothetical protein
MAITQAASGKYYCKIAGSPPLVCKSPDQPTGADCGELPPTGDQACAYGNPRVYGRVTKLNLLQRLLAKKSTGARNFTGESMSTNSYLMLAGGAVIGALVARKFVKKGNKNTNTIIGGIVGLAAGYGATKIIKK